MSSESITATLRDGIAVIALSHPPVNSLGHGLREGILAQLASALSNPAVQGIVLTGCDKAFSAGADVTEFGTPRQLQEPILRTVLTRIETSDKPVIAAVNGIALGGGLEMALACHGRVALASARVGLTELQFGLIPGAGGTQRLPRLVGIAAAYGLMDSEKPQAAEQLRDTGLFDEVVEDDLIGVALRRAHTLIEAGKPYPRARDGTLGTDAVLNEVERQRSKLNSRQKLQPAYTALLDALSALSLPFDDGMRRERELFLSLMSTTASQALRYQFKAERDAGKLPAEIAGPTVSPRAIHSLAVVGAGTMGTGIAVAALDAGFSVRIIEQDQAALKQGAERIAAHYRGQVAAGKVSVEEAANAHARLACTLDWTVLRDADLVIEAVFEDLEVKQSVFRLIDTHARAGAVLATNTSYLDVDAIASATSRPRDVLGLHFFSPANVMKLIEVVRGAQTSRDVIATGMAMGAALRKTPVLTGNAFGFIGNRIYNAYRRECEFMLEDGAWPEEIDSALTGFGFAMGPFAVADLSGLDIAWRMRKSQAAYRDPRERYVDVLDRLCEMGRLGRKAGTGYYDYAEGKRAGETSAVVRDLILQASSRRGVQRRSLSADEIRRRALMTMANEAAHLIAEGIAARASDVDVVLVQGYGFPRWEGGPVFWARRQDRRRLESDLATMAEDAGYGFVIANLDPLFA